MIRKMTESIETNEFGEAVRIVYLSGFIEKIQLIYALKKELPIATTQLVIETSEGEKVLELTGNKNQCYYPRTNTHNCAGTVDTFDGNNPVPTRFYCHDFAKISVRSAEPKALIYAVNIFYLAKD